MLIIEGPDGVGKTTLCHKLRKLLIEHPARVLSHVYAHFSRLPSVFDQYWGYVERASANIVQDRFHMSEIVYALACKRASPLTPEMYRLVDGHLRKLGAFTVLVTADIDLIESRWDTTQMYDKQITIDAASEFRLISACAGQHYITPQQEFSESYTQPAREYIMDVDYRYHCSRENPYVDDAAIAQILERYLTRLDTCTQVSLTRPATL